MRVVHFDDMAWPLPDPDLEWILRYGTPSTVTLLEAASILSAYGALIRSDLKTIARVRTKLRAAERGK